MHKNVMLTAGWMPLTGPALPGHVSCTEIKVMMTMAHDSYDLHLGSAWLSPGLVTQRPGCKKAAQRGGDPAMSPASGQDGPGPGEVGLNMGPCGL